MPPYFGSSHIPKEPVQEAYHETHIEDNPALVEASPAELERLGDIHRQTTRNSHAGFDEKDDSHTEFKDFLQDNNPEGKWYPAHQGVCYDSLSVFGSSGTKRSAKTLGTAIWRTLTFQDVLEKVIPSSLKLRTAQPKPILSDFSGVVRSREMLL